MFLSSLYFRPQRGAIRLLRLLALASIFMVHPGRACAVGDPPPKQDEQLWRVENCCGLNCLYFVLRARGLAADYQALQRRFMASALPASLADIAREARAQGSRLSVARTDPAGLRDIPKPAVAHFEGVSEKGEAVGHFVVVLRTDDSGVTCLDGTTAETRSLSWSEFEESWSGYVAFPTDRSHKLLLGLISGAVGVALALVIGRWMPRRGGLVLLGLAWVLCWGQGVVGNELQIRTVQDIAPHVARNWDRIESLRVEYFSRHVSGRGDGLRTILTVKGARRSVQSTHGALKPTEDPRSWHQLFTVEEWNVFAPYHRRYEVSRQFATAPYTNKITAHMFFEATAWWPAGDKSPPLRLRNGRPHFLSDVLRDATYVIVLVKFWKEQTAT